MPASSSFRACFVLVLLLAGFADRAHATPPAAPAAVRRAQQLTAYFAQSLDLSAPQEVRLQAPALRLLLANDSLARRPYAKVARAAAARTAVERHFFAAAAAFLTANQLDDLIVLHNAMHADQQPWAAAH